VLEVEIRKIDATGAMRKATDVDDARLAAASQQGQQEPSEREVPQVVGSQLHFEAVSGELSLGQSHDAGVIDQQIDRPFKALNSSDEICNRCEIGEIEALETQQRSGSQRPDFAEDPAAMRLVSSCEDDIRTCLGQGDGCFEAQSARCTGNDC
jgi:hypothetical protein